MILTEPRLWLVKLCLRQFQYQWQCPVSLWLCLCQSVAWPWAWRGRACSSDFSLHSSHSLPTVMTHRFAKELERAASVVSKAKALVVTAGAGMRVDSGLPDYRGPNGLWRGYPPFKKLGIQLAGTSNPYWFQNDPEFAWGFFGHRYNLYSNATPHSGYNILRSWGDTMQHGYFVFTSNIDGHFQRAGIDENRIVEYHGSINFLQCVDPTISDCIWPMPPNTRFEVDEDTLRTKQPLPMGPPNLNTVLARPNILMFGDLDWIGHRTDEQEKRFYNFQMLLQQNAAIPVVIVEIGAGLAVPTVRVTSESMLGPRSQSTLIRINTGTRECSIPKGNHIALCMGGQDALEMINNLLIKW